MHYEEVVRFSLRVRSRVARWVLVLALAFATPAVQDALTDFTMWVTGQACCADDCDESGAPCTQQCAHCPCGGGIRTATLHTTTAEAFPGWARELAGELVTAVPSSTTQDPPFRPPVS